MQLFYHPELKPGILSLPTEEAYHAAKVLRLRPGNSLHLTDGIGRLAEARILTCDTRETKVEIVTLSEAKSPGREIHIAIAPTKSPDRFEFFVEKAVELGVTCIIPLETSKSERIHLKTERLNKIIVSAAKQSHQLYFPVLQPITKFADFVASAPKGLLGIAHCHTPIDLSISRFALQPGTITMAIGPEGDFTAAEVSLAIQAGFAEINLGTFRLRTETAGIVAVAAASLLAN